MDGHAMGQGLGLTKDEKDFSVHLSPALSNVHCPVSSYGIFYRQRWTINSHPSTTRC